MTTAVSFCVSRSASSYLACQGTQNQGFDAAGLIHCSSRRAGAHKIEM